MCTGATLYRCPATKGGGRQDVKKGWAGAARGSADNIQDMTLDVRGHVGQHVLCLLYFCVANVSKRNKGESIRVLKMYNANV